MFIMDAIFSSTLRRTLTKERSQLHPAPHQNIFLFASSVLPLFLFLDSNRRDISACSPISHIHAHSKPQVPDTVGTNRHNTRCSSELTSFGLKPLIFALPDTGNSSGTRCKLPASNTTNKV